MLKVIVVQNFPKFSEIEKNSKNIEQQIEKQNIDNLDLIVLPEMCLTGYDFPNQQILEESSEYQKQGFSYEFMRKIAQKYKCYIVGGYPEKYEDVYYNSSYILDRQGNMIMNYRKTHMYTTDNKFYQPGNGYKCFDIETLSGKKLKVFPFICMDLNFSTVQNFAQKEKPDLLIFIANWIDNKDYQYDDMKAQNQILNYWTYMLVQYLMKIKSLRYMITCNRVGLEDNTKFIGTSNIMKFHNEITLIKMASRNDEQTFYEELKYN